MALKAPFHVEGIFFPHQGHLIYLAVTALTADPLVDMDVVFEVDNIW